MASRAAFRFRFPSLFRFPLVYLFLIACFSPRYLQESVDTCLQVDGFCVDQAGNNIVLEKHKLLSDGDEGKGCSTEMLSLSRNQCQSLESTTMFGQEGEQDKNKLKSHDSLNGSSVFFCLIILIGLWLFFRWLRSKTRKQKEISGKEKPGKEVQQNQTDEVEEVAAPLGRIIALLINKVESSQLSSSKYFEAEEISQVLRSLSTTSLSPVLGEVRSSKFASSLASSFQEIYTTQISLRRLHLLEASSDKTPDKPPDRPTESHESETRKRKGFAVGKSLTSKNKETPELRRCSKLVTGDTLSHVEKANSFEKMVVNNEVVEESDTGRKVDCKESPGAGAPFVSNWESVLVGETDGSEGNCGNSVHSEGVHRHTNRTESFIVSEDNENGFWRGGSSRGNGSLVEVEDRRELAIAAVAPLIGSQMQVWTKEGSQDLNLSMSRLASAVEYRNNMDAQFAAQRLHVKWQMHSDIMKVKTEKEKNKTLGNALVAQSNVLFESKLKMSHTKLTMSRTAAIEKKIYETCISVLVSGQIATIAGTCWAMCYFGYNSLYEKCQCDLKSEGSTSWKTWFAPSLTSSIQGVSQSISCQLCVWISIVAGLTIMVPLCWILHKAAKHRNQYFYLVTVVEIFAAGFLGFSSVNKLGGNGARWIICWETLIVCSSLGALFPASIFKILEGYSPEEDPPEGKFQLWPPKWMRRAIFQTTTIFVLPFTASIIPFFPQAKHLLYSTDWRAWVESFFL